MAPTAEIGGEGTAEKAKADERKDLGGAAFGLGTTLLPKLPVLPRKTGWR